MSIDTLTQDILDARRKLPRFIPDDLAIVTNTNAAHDLAEHLTTRGWAQQTTITTLDELNALPESSVVKDGLHGEVFALVSGAWSCTGVEYDMMPEHIHLPARVLYRPEEE